MMDNGVYCFLGLGVVRIAFWLDRGRLVAVLGHLLGRSFFAAGVNVRDPLDDHYLLYW